MDETVFEVVTSDDVTGEALIAERYMTVCKPEKVKFAWTERIEVVV